MSAVVDLLPFDIELVPILLAIVAAAILVVRYWPQRSVSQTRTRAHARAPVQPPRRRPAPKPAAKQREKTPVASLAETITSHFSTRERQWQRLAAHIETASSRARELRQAHEAVSTQLDVAELGLERLKEELGSVAGTSEASPGASELTPAPATGRAAA